jgi:hypothetical protein
MLLLSIPETRGADRISRERRDPVGEWCDIAARLYLFPRNLQLDLFFSGSFGVGATNLLRVFGAERDRTGVPDTPTAP